MVRFLQPDGQSLVQRLESLVKVFTVCILPIISIAFQVMYEAEKEQQEEWLVRALVLGMIGGIVAFVVYPAIKSGLNGKGRLAESMKTDLKHIQLTDSLGAKNPETEPTALQAATQENGEENEQKKIFKSGCYSQKKQPEKKRSYICISWNVRRR